MASIPPGEEQQTGLVPEMSSPLDERARLRGIVLLAGAIFALGLGVNMHMAMNVPYLHELLSASSWQQGYLESIRETCGILSFFVIALLAGRSEPRTAAVMMMLVGGGLAAYCALHTIPHVIVFSLVWSFGFHAWVPLSRSMQLALARKGREGRTLGVLRSVGAVGVLLALGSIYVLKVHVGFGMRELFLLGGAFTALGAIPLFFMPTIRARKPQRMPLRRAMAKGYRLFCGLELLDGMRKQIFLLFAVLMLVYEHGVQVETIAALMFVNQAACLVLAPVAGYLVDRFGERPVLTAYFAGIAVVFVLYAMVTSLHALYVIYVIDNALFVLKIALPIYANRIAPKSERTQLLAMGVTMNHVGAVILPLVGGALYATMGYRFPFYCGTGIAVLSIIIAQAIPSRKPSGQAVSAT